MKEEKLCPLTFNDPENVMNCKKEQCAWWTTIAPDTTTMEKGCCMVIIGRLIFDIDSKIK